MGAIGSFLMIAGVAFIILSFIGYNLRILYWIDMWGVTVGWIIRVGMIILGAVLFFLGEKSE